MLAGWQTPALADEGLDAARNAFQRGEHRAALQVLRPAAQRGDPGAQFLLGVAHTNGQGVPRDPAAATRWYAAAARQGHAAAQFNLGNAYRHGRGVAPDPEQALHWWRMAARQGLANASHNLAVHYLQDPVSAAARELGLAWLRQAAERGWPDALQALRLLDSSGAAQEGARDQLLLDEAELLIDAPQHHVVQLMAAGSLAIAQDYVRAAGLRPHGRVFRLPKDGRTLWVVVYGSYADRDEAQAVIARMRPELREYQPWARRVGEIQQFVRDVWRREEATPLPRER